MLTQSRSLRNTGGALGFHRGGARRHSTLGERTRFRERSRPSGRWLPMIVGSDIASSDTLGSPVDPHPDPEVVSGGPRQQVVAE
jgi:hypothetical protein